MDIILRKKKGTFGRKICPSAPVSTVNRACTGVRSEGSVLKDFIIFNILLQVFRVKKNICYIWMVSTPYGSNEVTMLKSLKVTNYNILWLWFLMLCLTVIKIHIYPVYRLKFRFARLKNVIVIVLSHTWISFYILCLLILFTLMLVMINTRYNLLSTCVFFLLLGLG